MGPVLGSLFYAIKSMYLFLCQYHADLMVIALWYRLKSGIVVPPTLVFFFSITLAIQGLLCFHTHFMIACSSLEKNAGAMWLGLHIIWGLCLVVLTCHQYLFFQSTSMGGFSLSLYLLQYPSQAFYSFQHTDLFHLWLGLFLGIFWLFVHCKLDPFLYFSFCCFIIGV